MTELFTPKNSALLMIDHQVGTMQLIKNIDVAQDVGGLCQCDRHLLCPQAAVAATGRRNLIMAGAPRTFASYSRPSWPRRARSRPARLARR
jgi:hypothetical protein